MPFEWVPIPLSDPAVRKREIQEIVSRNRGGLDELFLDMDNPKLGYALVHVVEGTDMEKIIAQSRSPDTEKPTIKLETVEERHNREKSP